MAVHFVIVDRHFSEMAEEAEDQRGIASPSGLRSAWGAPAQTFGGKDLHADVLTKAAVLMRSLIENHPFVNGNKRTTVISTALFLEDNGYELRVDDRQLINVATRIASPPPISVDRIKRWLKKYTRKTQQEPARLRKAYTDAIIDWIEKLMGSR